MILQDDPENHSPLPARLIFYYVTARRWLTDLEFFSLEAPFLHSLTADYFIRLTDDSDSCKKLSHLALRFLKLEKEIGKYSLELQERLQLTATASSCSSKEEEALATRQVHLDVLIPRLTCAYRATKKELFTLVGAIVRENQFLVG